jgi:hypothetical protein
VVAMKKNCVKEVCPVCGEPLVEFDFVEDVKRGFRVCPVGFGSCDIGVDECNPVVERFGGDFAVSLKCPHLKVRQHHYVE